MSVMADLTIFPVGKGESLSPYVARAVSIIEASGLPYTLGPMGTAIEGEWDEVMAVVTACFKDLEADCDRINLALKVDYRKGNDRMEHKPRSVREKMQKA